MLPSLRLSASLAARAARACVPASAPAAVCVGSWRGLKATTGIVGLPVVEDARGALESKYDEVLMLVAELVPAEAEYRRQVEKTVKYKLEVLAAEADDAAAEGVLGRQLEEEIRMCEDELTLIPKMAEWKPWEVPEGHLIELLEEKPIVHEEAAPAK